LRRSVEIDPKLVGLESEIASDWKKSSDSNEVYADRGGIPHCPSGRPLGERALGIGATVAGEMGYGEVFGVECPVFLGRIRYQDRE
jgi:hypothetical protein